MNTKYFTRLFTILFVSFLVNATLKAQITIGKDKTPGKYSVLQVEYDKDKYTNGAGVLLPRLDASAIIDLEAKIRGKDVQEAENATGLIVFNTTTKKVIYWDGSKWIAVPSEIVPQFAASNGLTATKSVAGDMTTVGLGGELSNHTEIHLNGKEINVQQGAGAEFGVKSGTENILTVKDGKIGVNTNAPQALLHVNKKDGMTGFRYADGTQGPYRALTLANEDGTAHWEDIKTNVVKAGSEYTKTPLKIGTTEHSLGTIKCTVGKWMIIAKANTTLRHWAWSETDFDFKYTRIRVRKRVNGTTSDPVLAVSGETTEFGGYQVALPTISFYQVFTNDTTIELWVEGKSTNSWRDPWPAVGSQSTSGDVGFFHAIRLSEETNN